MLILQKQEKEDNCKSLSDSQKLSGSSFWPSLQLVGRVAGLLVKVNKNREPHPHRTCNAAQKKSTNWSIKCLLEPIPPNICAHCPIAATLILAHYSECSQHQETRILRSPLSKNNRSTTMAYLIRGLGPSPTPPHGDLIYYWTQSEKQYVLQDFLQSTLSSEFCNWSKSKVILLLKAGSGKQRLFWSNFWPILEEYFFFWFW